MPSMSMSNNVRYHCTIQEKGREREAYSNFDHIKGDLVDIPSQRNLVRVGVARSCLQVSVFLGS